MPTTPRIKIPYPSSNKDNWYNDFVSMINAVDSSLYASREDRNLILMGGGTISFSISGDVGTLTWDDTIEILSASTGFIWEIPADSIELNDNELFYVTLTRSPIENVELDPEQADVITSSDDKLVIGVFKTDRVYFRNGDVIFDGESFDLFSSSTSVSSLSSSNPVQIDAADSADPGVSTAGSRADHQHAVNTAIAGDLVAIDAAVASAGTSIKIPRADHKHTITTGVPGAVTFTSASAGVATSIARSDHIHSMASGTPSDTGTTNSEGVSANPARVDHVHRTIVKVSSSGSLTGSRPQIDFSSSGFTLTDNGGSDRVDVQATVDFSLFIPGSPGAGAMVFMVPITRTIVFPASMTGSRAIAETASTGTAVFSLVKNSTEFATITFDASATGSFTAASSTTFTNVDKLVIVAPNPQDGTLADIGISLAGLK